MNRELRSNRGITLVELLVALALLSLALVVAFNIFFVSRQTFITGVDKSAVQQDARFIGNRIANELRFAKEVSTSTIAGEKHFRLDLDQHDVTNNLYRVKITEYSAAGNIESTSYVGNYVIQDGVTYTTGGTSKNVIDFTINATTGNQSFPVESSVKLMNVFANIPNGTTTIYYTLYE
ncbi:prepilin-type N-terminal cleavage/methylation domain-containing protein [Alkalibacter saccharofermentans]|uniref:Prepilin-type N-terminal cleavage/methylation domain-containing protein n=1 Tax=Alkalibacter saccharofermentans DSM 14828 TaxID=1120975 RepID=A0A1M4S917_9FIRM|nr:prepilin-type N-terminal cleavage/methylation domain-containing protein [Alkalibacter saccharofermentans]SHE28682.1 prepilin-type N-terminal cleavage/methylation domain-containing protein [Alkalibacter saccharofermentans DSM 14828]